MLGWRKKIIWSKRRSKFHFKEGKFCGKEGGGVGSILRRGIFWEKGKEQRETGSLGHEMRDMHSITPEHFTSALLYIGNRDYRGNKYRVCLLLRDHL